MHTYNNVRDALVKIVCEQVGLDYGNQGEEFRKLAADGNTRMSALYDEAGTDSLDEIEILMEIEDYYQTEIPDIDAQNLFAPQQTVEQAVTNIVEWLNTHDVKVPA